MFIRELHVDGYGALHSLSCSLHAPVTVVYGPNEAGKSTLLRFIRSMLYGIPTRKDLVERGEPVFGGRHGGRMLVSASGGRQWMLERYADGGGLRKTAGGLIVRDENGAELGWSQSEWERHGLGGVSERLFRQLFAVSLDELHELRTLQGEEIGNFLYHAGLAGGAALSEARKKLAGDMDKLYRPRGTTQEMNRILAAIKETEAVLRQSRSGVAMFLEAKEALARTEEKLLDLERTLPPLIEKVAELQGAVNLREWWLKRKLLLEEEEQLVRRLPNPQDQPLSDEAASAWAELQRNRGQARERYSSACLSVQQLRSELDALPWDEALLEHAAELEKLDAMREAVIARQEETESVTADLRLLEDTIQSLLSRLSPEWREDDLAAFASVTTERESLRRMQQAWGEAERRRERLEADAARLQRQREALTAEARNMPQAAQHMPDGTTIFRATSRETLQQAWNVLEDELRRFERAHTGGGAESTTGSADPRKGSSRAARQPARKPSLPLFAATALLALVAIVFAFSSNRMIFTAAAGVAAIFALFTGWAAFRMASFRRSPKLDSTNNMGEVLQERESRVRECLRDLLVNPDIPAASLLQDDVWKRLRRQVQDELSRLERREQELVRSQELQRRIAELDREKESLGAEIRAAIQRLDELQAEWSNWLGARKLPAALTPDSLPDLLNLAEQGQTAIRSRTRALERKSALDELQAGFRQSAAALFEVCPPPASMRTDPALSVTWLFRKVEEQRAVKAEAVRTERLLKQAEAAVIEARQVLDKAEGQVLQVIREAQAEDEQAYEQRLHIDERRRNLTRERREIELRLEAGRSAESAAALYLLLDSHDEAMLTTLLRQAEEARDASERERTELLDRRGRLAQELERLQREAEAEDRRLRLAELESKLEQLAERYAVLAIADRLLKDTKAVFEEERQPEVLRIASHYFAGMSGGAYSRIIAPADSNAILAETADRRLTDSAFLSRGTQEQLYLAMRFALAEAASGEIPLPLLLDDLFVHFDERRLRETVSVLGEIAQSRQVILFTCHRHVAEALQDGLPAAQIMEWAARGA
ncbi:AAA family ATPase [Cohnella pontilimi]|nr:AAA family ATPase [Cohnella pontilimi]